MKIGIVGTRGVPAKYGGFETFAEQISIRLVKRGYDCTVYCDRDSHDADEFKGVRLRFSKYTKTDNPILFYKDTIQSSLKENDVVLVAGTGGSYFYFYNLASKKVLITNTDGVESRRAKWSLPKKAYIKLSEILAVKFSHALIADAAAITKYLEETYPKHPPIHTIEYGGEIPESPSAALLTEYGLEPGSYYTIVARMEPENHIREIIEGFSKSNTRKSLVILGALPETPYVQEILKYKSERVRFMGAIWDRKTVEAFRYFSSGNFHGHSVGGTNPSLLEALASRQICICHSNEFNREVTNNTMFYFSRPDDIPAIVEKVEQMTAEEREAKKGEALSRITSYYNWENMTEKYHQLFSSFADKVKKN